jgi:universal stress protein E
MTPFKISRVLVALKQTHGARAVVRKAAQIASAHGAALELFHGLSEPIALELTVEAARGLKSLEQLYRDRALQRLECIAAALRARHAGLRVSVSAEWDAPAHEAIVRRALKIKADLIVATSHVGPHLMPGLMRLTDWELVRLSPVPLLLVRSARMYHRPAVLVAVDPSHAFSKPLKLDRSLLQVGERLSRRLHGSLHAVHAFARIPGGAIPPGALAFSDRSLQQIEAQARQAAEANLERVLRGSSVKAAHRYLIGRHPVDAVLQASRKCHSAIVVMGAVSRSGLKRLLIGNTAESILDQVRCDVLVVKPRSFRSRVPRAVQGPRFFLQTPAPWPGSY